MTALFWDGFNHDVDASLAFRYRDISAGVSITASGRDSTNGLTGSSDADSLILDVDPATTNEGVQNLALFCSSLPSSAHGLMQVLAAGDVPILSLVLETDGTLTIRNGDVSGSVLGTTASLITTSTWHDLEWRWHLAFGLNGTSVLKVNNAVRLNLFDLSNSAVAWVAVKWFPGNLIFDDLAVFDGQIMLGPQRVLTSYAGSDGARVDWTASAGPERFQDIDETPHDGDTTYIWADANQQRSTFIFASFDELLLESVTAVALHAIARESGPLGTKIRHLTRIDAIDDPIPGVADAQELTADYAEYTYRWNTNPRTGIAWLIGEVNAAEWGIERVSDDGGFDSGFSPGYS